MMAENIGAWLADWDQSVVETLPEDEYPILRRLGQEDTGYNVTDDELCESWGHGPREEIRVACGLGKISDDDYARLKKRYDELRLEMPKNCKPGAERVLKAARAAGKVLGIVSSLDTPTIYMEMPKTGLDEQMFHLVHGSDLTGSVKPAPEFFERALRQLKHRGISPAETVYIGDSERDAEATWRVSELIMNGCSGHRMGGFIGLAIGEISSTAGFRKVFENLGASEANGFYAFNSWEEAGDLLLPAGWQETLVQPTLVEAQA